MVWGALVGAGLQYLGNRKANKQNAERHKIDDARYAKADYDQSFEGIRANAEAAGFNPAAVVGVGSGTGAGGSSSGAAFSSTTTGVGSLVASAFQQDAQIKIQKAQLELENRRLNEIVEDTILRPQIAGIYGDRRARNQDTQTPETDNTTFTDRLRDGFDLSTHYDDRPTTLEENRDMPATAIMSSPFGSNFTILNNEVFEEGPMAWANGMYAAGALALDYTRQAVSNDYQYWKNRLSAPAPLSPPSSYAGPIPDNPMRYRN